MSKTKILVVDDMAIVRDPIAASLTLAGYDTPCAADGKAALAAMRRDRPDLVLMDLAMPEMDGLAVLRAMRADPGLTNVPVIVLTASAERRHVIEARQFGIKEYMLKSRFKLADLLERVRKHTGETPKPGPGGGDGPVPSSSSSSSSLQRTELGRPGKAPLEAKPFDRQSLLSASPVPPAPATVPPRPAAPAAATPAGINGGKKPAAPAPAETIPCLLTREECLDRTRTALQAKTLSGVVAQVISLAASPRGDLSQLATLIGRDPMLSARVLQAANSVAYQCNRGVVTTIPEAIRNIGCTTVRNIAAALGIFDAMPATGPDGFNPIRCWQHSFAVAQLCARMHGATDESGAGTAYLVGLCHDLGDILFHSHFAAEYQQVVEAEARTGRPREELERKMLGMAHGELVSTILMHLGLPEGIRTPVESLHAALAGRRRSGTTTDPLARVLWQAEMYANGALLASGGDAPVAAFTAAECRLATGQPNPPRPDTAALRAEIYALTGMLARLSARDEAEVMVPLFPQHQTLRVCLARDPALSGFDPIATALESLATVEVLDRLPAPADLARFGALVVVAADAAAAGFTGPDIQRALAAAPLSALWLTAKPLPAERLVQPVAGLAPLALPMPLDRLAGFVHQVAEGRRAEAA